MKKPFLGFTLTIACVIASFTGFAQQDKKIVEAKKELKEAKLDSVAEAKKFIEEAQQRISSNQKKIEELKVQRANETQELNAKYQERLNVIEKRNKDLKDKIDSYNTNKSTKWDLFKSQVTYDLNEVIRVIEDND